MRERHVRELLGEAARRGGWVRGMRRAEAVLRWPELVGPDVARFARAVALQAGTLVVEVSDPETALHLGLQRERLLTAYRTRYGRSEVRDLRFRVGVAATVDGAVRPTRDDPDPPALDPLELAALASGLDDLPEHVATPAAAAGRALAVGRAHRRAAGWRPCPVCGTLADPAADLGDGPAVVPLVARSGPVLCRACAHHARTPRVQDAAARLLVAPGVATPALTEDERLVARALALARAAVATRELLPHVLAEPAARAPLERLVRCTAALRRGVAELPELGDVDPARDGIDPRAWRALGHLPPRRAPAQEAP